MATPAEPAHHDLPASGKTGPSIAIHLSGDPIRVTGNGFWTATYIDDHFDKLDSAVTDVRRRHGHARVIVDLRKAPVQATDVAERIRIRTQQIYATADRVAVVAETNLLTMQMRRATRSDNIRSFISIDAAQAWLSAKD